MCNRSFCFRKRQCPDLGTSHDRPHDLEYSPPRGRGLSHCLRRASEGRLHGLLRLRRRRDNSLQSNEIRVAISAAAGLFAGCLFVLWFAAGLIGALLTAPLLAGIPPRAPSRYELPHGERRLSARDRPRNRRWLRNVDEAITDLVLVVCLVLFLLLVAINVMLDWT